MVSYSTVVFLMLAIGGSIIGLNTGNIDFVVDYLQRERVDFERCIPRIRFQVSGVRLEKWPSSCSPMEAGKVVEPDRQHWWSRRLKAREYCFTNEPSGREFRVWLELGTFVEFNVVQGRREFEIINHLHLLF